MDGSIPQQAVEFLRDKSAKYKADLNQLPIFQVLMILDHRDRMALEDILFGRWELNDE